MKISILSRHNQAKCHLLLMVSEGGSGLFKTGLFKPDHEFDVATPDSVNCLNGELLLYDITDDWLLEEHKV